MDLSKLVEQVVGFDALPTRDKCRLFAWYLHTHKQQEFFETKDVSECFKILHLQMPNVAQALQRMTTERKPPDLSKHRSGYKLLRTIRTELDKKYIVHESFAVISKILAELPEKIPDVAEKSFFLEALSCYRIKAYRACIVMTWNLAFDHLLRWILHDPRRLANFNAAISKRFPKKLSIAITQQEHFEELKESDIIDVCQTAGLMSSNIIRILKEKLTKRNMSAHPSQIIVTQSQTDDVVTDLVNNVVLALI